MIGRRLLLAATRLGALSRTRITIIYEAKATQTLRQTLNADLLGLPTRTKLRARNPETRTTDDSADARTTDEELLYRNTLIALRLATRVLRARVIELRRKDAVLLLERDLDRRRIGLRLALLVHRDLHHPAQTHQLNYDLDRYRYMHEQS